MTSADQKLVPKRKSQAVTQPPKGNYSKPSPLSAEAINDAIIDAPPVSL